MDDRAHAHALASGFKRFRDEDEAEEGWTYKGEQIVRRWIGGGDKRGFWVILGDREGRWHHRLDLAAKAIDKMHGEAT